MNVPSEALWPRFKGDKTIEFERRDVPNVGRGQLLIRSRANAVCASEVGAYLRGSRVTPGHECAGVVAVTGEGASTPVGTPGVIFLMDFCGQCRSCRQGFTNQCLAKRADYGFSHDGGYGPFVLVNENVFFPVDPDLSPAESTMLLDVMGTGGHSIKRARSAHPDPRSLLITGCGPIGLGILAMAKITLGKDFPVLITDMVPYRLALAERLGGRTIAIDRETIPEGIKRHGFAEVDLAIDSSGKSQARRGALDVLAKRGVLALVGHGQDLALDVSRDMIGPERTVLGSEYFCYNELPQNLEYLRKNRAYLGQIVTERHPVSEIKQAFDAFLLQNTGKVVVEQ